MKTVSPFSACWALFAVQCSEGGNLSVCHAAAAAGTDSGRGASWGGVHWHFAVAAHDGAGPVCDDAGDAWADGVGVDHGVEAGDRGARALSPFTAENDDKPKWKKLNKREKQIHLIQTIILIEV